MIYKTYVPRESLSSFVDYFWFFSGCNPPGAKELNLPEGAGNLLINLREGGIRIRDRHNREIRLGSSGIYGPQSDYFMMENSNERSMMGVQFKSGSTAAILGARAASYEVANSFVALNDLWGTGATDLRDQLLYASSTTERFRILKKYLSARIDYSRKPNSAVAFALDKYRKFHHIQLIRDTIEQVNLTPKRFLHMFKEEVGITPKRFYRLMRFQKALQLIRQREQADWLDIALTCGYYDQAHFNRDFHSFTSLTPTEYRMKNSMHPYHVPIL